MVSKIMSKDLEKIRDDIERRERFWRAYGYYPPERPNELNEKLELYFDDIAKEYEQEVNRSGGKYKKKIR